MNIFSIIYELYDDDIGMAISENTNSIVCTVKI
jgi:hypothetical protein